MSYWPLLHEKEAEIGRQKKKIDELSARDKKNAVMILQVQVDSFFSELEIHSLKRKLAGLESVKPPEGESLDIERTFQALAEKWRKETGHISSITKLVMHPSYQSIVGLGPRVVPILLYQLQQKPEHWFWALSAITRENPVPSEAEGNIRNMAEAWLQWGRQAELI